MSDDLHATYEAWKNGKLERTHGVLFYVAVDLAVAALGASIAFALVRRRKRSAY